MRLGKLIAPALAIYAITSSVSYGLHGDWWAYDGFIDEIASNVPPGQRVFMEDLSGRLALLSDRPFVSGDGLVNSNEYLHRFLIPGRVDKYLEENHIEYFLTSNIQCPPLRKRMPWTRDVEMVFDSPEQITGRYKVIVDISYLTKLAVVPSILYFTPEQLVFDKCHNGIRELLFKLRDSAPENKILAEPDREHEEDSQ